MTLPRLSGQDDDSGPIPRRNSRRTAIIVGAIAVVVFVVVLLHVTGTIKH